MKNADKNQIYLLSQSACRAKLTFNLMRYVSIKMVHKPGNSLTIRKKFGDSQFNWNFPIKIGIFDEYFNLVALYIFLLK